MGHIDLSADMATSKTVAQAAAYNDALTKIQTLLNGNIDTTNVVAGLLSTAGTSFPGSPTDGQELVFQADLTNGIFWRMRYYLASTYWGFVGGSPLSARVDTREGTASASYADLATVGPSIVLPFTGSYWVEWGCRADGTSGDQANVGLTATGHAATDADSIEMAFPASGSFAMSRGVLLTGISGTLKMQYKTNADTSFFKSRWISATPVKK